MKTVCSSHFLEGVASSRASSVATLQCIDYRERINIKMTDSVQKVVEAIGTALADCRRTWSQQCHLPLARRPCCRRETGLQRSREKVEEEEDSYTKQYLVLTLNT